MSAWFVDTDVYDHDYNDHDNHEPATRRNVLYCEHKQTLWTMGHSQYDNLPHVSQPMGECCVAACVDSLGLTACLCVTRELVEAHQARTVLRFNLSAARRLNGRQPGRGLAEALA